MNTLELMSKVPATKSEQMNLAETFIRRMEEGEVSPVEAVVQMKSLAEAIGLFLKDERVKNAVLAECEKYGKGERPSFRGATVQVKETGVKYDFMACGDPVYTDLATREAEIADERKAREKFLRTLTKPKTELDEETGEVYNLLPPVRQSTTTFAITFKNE